MSSPVNTGGGEVIGGELDFGQSRRLEAQIAMRYVLDRLEKVPFTGSRLIEGQVVPEFESAEDAATYYRGALDVYLRGLGAEITEARVLYGDTHAPFEDVLIYGKVPGVAVTAARKVSAQIVEACAEMLRVLIATAVVAAAEDCQDEEGVMVFFRQVEFGGKVDFEHDRLVGLGRMRVLVYTSHEPRASYLLGGVHGGPGTSLQWEFPFVEHVYGPNRLRWRDLRSPDYEAVPEAQPKIVVPS